MTSWLALRTIKIRGDRKISGFVNEENEKALLESSGNFLITALGSSKDEGLRSSAAGVF